MFDLITFLVPPISSEAEVKHTPACFGGSQPEKGKWNTTSLGWFCFSCFPTQNLGWNPQRSLYGYLPGFPTCPLFAHFWWVCSPCFVILLKLLSTIAVKRWNRVYQKSELGFFRLLKCGSWENTSGISLTGCQHRGVCQCLSYWAPEECLGENFEP